MKYKNLVLVLLFSSSFYARTFQHQFQASLQNATVPELHRLYDNTADQSNQVKGTCLAHMDWGTNLLSVALLVPSDSLEPTPQDPEGLPALFWYPERRDMKLWEQLNLISFKLSSATVLGRWEHTVE